MKRYAAVVVWTTPRKALYRHTVEVVDDGRLLVHYPLQEELPFTQWLQGMLIVLPQGENPCLHLHELFDWWEGLPQKTAPGETRYVWLVSKVFMPGECTPEDALAHLLGQL